MLNLADSSSLRARLSALLEARYSGERRIRYQTNGIEREIEYRSDADLAAAIADVESRIAALEASPTARRVTTVRISSSKGFIL
jgi:hypothetical protein